MNPNDTDGHQVGNGLGAEQPNTFAPNTGAIPNTVTSEAFSAPQQNTFTPNTGDAFNAPQAPIISSTPDPEDKKESSITRAFGGRSRASRIAAEAPAQPSNLRQNTPDFFQQGMQQQDLAYNATAEQKAKSKKGLLIGGIVGGVALLVIAIVAISVAITSNNKPYPNGLPVADAKDTFTDENVEAIDSLETTITSMSKTAMYIKPGVDISKNYKSTIESLQNLVDTYEKVYNELLNYEAIQYSEESAQYFADAKEKMAKMLPIYKEIVERYKLVLTAMSGEASLDTLSSLPGYDKKIKEDLDVVVQFTNLNKTYQKMNCTVEERTTPRTQCYIIKHQLIELENNTSSASRVDLRKMILADSLKEINLDEYKVRSALNNIKSITNNLEGQE